MAFQNFSFSYLVIVSYLIWELQYSQNGGVTALIWGASPQTRSDRRKDRVETNPEQLAAASAQAEISFDTCFNASTFCLTPIMLVDIFLTVWEKEF